MKKRVYAPAPEGRVYKKNRSDYKGRLVTSAAVNAAIAKAIRKNVELKERITTNDYPNTATYTTWSSGEWLTNIPTGVDYNERVGRSIHAEWVYLRYKFTLAAGATQTATVRVICWVADDGNLQNPSGMFTGTSPDILNNTSLRNAGKFKLLLDEYVQLEHTAYSGTTALGTQKYCHWKIPLNRLPIKLDDELRNPIYTEFISDVTSTGILSAEFEGRVTFRDG